MKRMTYRTDVKTIMEFIDMNNIDADPAHQRPQISDKKKRKGIIETIMDGYDTGEIKLNQFPLDIEEDEDITTSLEVIDGSNRLRSIRQFYNNKFSIFDNRFYNDLTSDEKKIFENYPLRFTIYDNLSPQAKAKQFITTNTVTEVNHQEMLNAYGTKSIACLVREFVRTVPSTDSVPDGLFESVINRKKDNFNFRFFNINNDRLRLEDNVARITYLCNEDNGLVAHGDKLLDDMYKKNFSDQDIKSLRKKIIPVFNFVKQCANARTTWFNVGLSLLEFVCLYRLYFYLLAEKGKFNIEDYDEFFKAFKEGFDAFASRDPTRNELVPQKGDKPDKLESDIFKDSLRKHEAVCKVAIELLLEVFDVTNHITELDKKRVFSRGEIETGLQRQNFKCWVDGKPLKMEEAEGGHIKAHIKGGKTVADNFRVMRRVHNRKMGKQDAREYKEALKSAS